MSDLDPLAPKDDDDVVYVIERYHDSDLEYYDAADGFSPAISEARLFVTRGEAVEFLRANVGGMGRVARYLRANIPSA